MCLTDKGYELFRKVAVEHIGTITERIGDSLSDDELRLLTDLCDRLRMGNA